MRYKRKIEAHVEEQVKDGRTTCDRCGKDVDKQPLYQDDDMNIEARIGTVYPEGDHRIVYEVDSRTGARGNELRERVLVAYHGSGDHGLARARAPRHEPASATPACRARGAAGMDQVAPLHEVVRLDVAKEDAG